VLLLLYLVATHVYTVCTSVCLCEHIYNSESISLLVSGTTSPVLYSYQVHALTIASLYTYLGPSQQAQPGMFTL